MFSSNMTAQWFGATEQNRSVGCILLKIEGGASKSNDYKAFILKSLKCSKNINHILLDNLQTRVPKISLTK